MRIDMRTPVLAACLLLPAFAHARDEWQPVSKAEQELADDPLERGAPAIILLREWHHDDGLVGFGTMRVTKAYERLKILTEEGRRYADVEIPYAPGKVDVKKIRARVVQPDGSVREVEPKPHEKLILKYGRLEMRAKTFSLPEIRPGTIIEYRWEYRSKVPPVTGSWPVQDDDLTILKGRYSVIPIQNPQLNFSWVGVIPPSLTIEKGEKKIWMDTERVPHLVKEPLMPPKAAQRYRVELFYTLPGYGAEKDFWTKNGEIFYGYFEGFTAKDRPVRQEAKRIAETAKTDAAKARAAYDLVQSMRNLTHRPAKEGESLPRIENVADVLEHRMGDDIDLTATFVALVRALGLRSDLVFVADRERHLFDRKIFDTEQLDTAIATVATGATTLWLDPGTPMAPYGLVAWQKTGLEGIVLKNPVDLVTVPLGTAYDAQSTRTSKLSLKEDGTLSGTIEIVFQGQDALAHRMEALGESAAEREKRISGDLLAALPEGATAKVRESDGWKDPYVPLKATVEIEVPGLATAAGDRLLLPLASVRRLHNPFEAAKREHPVLYPYPFVRDDAVTIALPEGFKVESVPDTKELYTSFGRHRLTAAVKERELSVTRRFAITAAIVGTSSYADLRDFYREARASDDANLVLRRR